MAHLPTLRDGILVIAPQAAPLQVGTQPWFDWLREARSFTFSGVAGTFTARHEERSGRRFWYAYRQRDGVLHKTYLGRSPELTLQRLEQAAHTLAHDSSKKVRADVQNKWFAPLITTKIAQPQLSTTLITRPSAIALCLEGITHPCTVITAPAGFGKTTLLAMTCVQFKERCWHVAWVSLEETERDPVRFWTYVLAALDSALPGIGLTTRGMLQSLRPSSIENTLTILINALVTAQEPVVLVLDDYHLAALPAVEQGLTFLIEHAPSTLRLLVATRVEPGFLLPRLRAQGRIAELHAAELRFSAKESERFMQETMRISLQPEHMARIIERAEGWVTGLQLAALSLREHVAGLELPLTASTSYVAAYLVGEVLEHQPQEVQAFLLQTSLLERMTGSLCDALTGRSDGNAMLTRLMQSQLFVTPLDTSLTWYRYHHLFAEILHERLQREDPALLAWCHRRAAQWFQQHDMLDSAIRHLIAAQAFEDAVTLIAAKADQLILRGEAAELVVWVRALPHAVLQAHPHLYVLFAVGLFLQGEMAEATACVNELEQRLAKSDTQSVIVEREIAVLRAILTLVGGDIFEGVELAREAARHLPERHLLRAVALCFSDAIALYGDVDLREADRKIGEFAEENLRAGNMLVAFMALVFKVDIEMYQGCLQRAMQTCHETLQLAPPVGNQELLILASIYCRMGEIRRERNDLAGAEGDLRHALTMGMNLSNIEFIVEGFISLAMVQAGCGKYEDALKTFEELHHQIYIKKMNIVDIVQMEDVRVRVLVVQGHSIELARWLEAYQERTQEQKALLAFPVIREMDSMALARVKLAQGCADEVIEPLETISTEAAQARRVRNVLEAKMLLARAYWLCGNIEEALQALDASLALAAPEGFMRMFLDEGEPMADVLAGYVANRTPSHERTHALKLLAAFGRATESSTLPLTETLSVRELEVLYLLATGRSNEAIASSLVLAHSTVKWHIARIYRKLGVAGRMQAVARARELHLIA